MSLDQFKSVSLEDHLTTSEDTSWDLNWHIKEEGYWDSIGSRFFDEDSPNKPPLMEVPEKLAADLEISDDPELVEEVASYWFPGREDDYVEVVKITYNDFSVWYWPLRPWDEDYENMRDTIVKRYYPQVIKWRAIVRGDDPSKALREMDKPWEEDEPKWFSDVDKTGLSEETRKWLNKNKDWIQHIDREINSREEEIDLGVEDEDWTDDW